MRTPQIPALPGMTPLGLLPTGDWYAQGYAAGLFDGQRNDDLRVSGTSRLPGYGEGYAAGWNAGSNISSTKREGSECLGSLK